MSVGGGSGEVGSEYNEVFFAQGSTNKKTEYDARCQ